MAGGARFVFPELREEVSGLDCLDVPSVEPGEEHQAAVRRIPLSAGKSLIEVNCTAHPESDDPSTESRFHC